MAVSGGFTESFNAGDRGFLILTCKCAAAITAGQVVALTGNADREINVAGAGSLVLKGVALQTATAVGDKIDVAFPGGVAIKVTASGAINAGDPLESAAAGKVRTQATIDVTGSFDPRAFLGWALEDIADTATGMMVMP